MPENTSYVVLLDFESEDEIDIDEACSLVNRLLKDILRSASGTFEDGSLRAFGPNGELTASIRPLSEVIAC